MNALNLPALLLLIGLTGCHPSYLKPAKGWHTLFPDHPNARVLAWQLVETYDPYDGGQLNPSTDGTVLAFFYTGVLLQTQPKAPPLEGKWFVNPTRDGLMLEFPASENLPYPKKGNPYPYKFALRHDTLVLSRQGRHGWVEQRYLATKDSVMVKSGKTHE